MAVRHLARVGLTVLLTLGLLAGSLGLLPVRKVAAATCTSTKTGNWTDSAMWDCGTPGANDDIVVADGHTVTIDTDVSVASITVGQGTSGVLQYQNTTTPRIVTVAGNLTLSGGGTLQAGSQSNQVVHELRIGGNLSIGDSATFNMGASVSPTVRKVRVTFNNTLAADVTLSSPGAPTLVRFMEIVLDRGASSNKVVCSVTAELGSGNAGITNGITYNNGTWEQVAGIFTFRGTYNQTLTANGNLTVSGSGSMSFGASVIVQGGTFLVNTSGVVTIGGEGNRLEPKGGTIALTAGTVNVGGRIGSESYPGIADTGVLTINGATVNVPAVLVSNSGSSVFAVGSGMTFQMSAGTLNILTANQGPFGENDIDVRSGTISGGTIVLGSASPGAQDFLARFDVAVHRLIVNVSSLTAQLRTSNLAVNDDLIISTGTLDANNLNINVAGNWANDGTFTAGTGTVTFNGSGVQSYSGSSTTTFYNLTVSSGAMLDVDDNPLFGVGGTLVNNGTLQQTQYVGTENTVFLNVSTNKYYGLEIDPEGSTDMGDTTVKISGNQFCPNAGDGVKRCYDIGPAIEPAATVKFFFTTAELDDETRADLGVYDWDGSQWVEEAGTVTNGGSGDGQWVQVTGVSSFSPFGLNDASPTAVKLLAFASRPASSGILLAWETATEEDNAGFHLYRSTRIDAVGVRLNAALIPSRAPGGGQGAAYTFLDATAEPGTTYYYTLEDVDLNGTPTPHGPVAAAVWQAYLPLIAR